MAAFGVTGACVAGLVGEFLGWRAAFFTGGAMGMLLLLLRVGVLESGMFSATAAMGHVRKGDLSLLLSSPARLSRYIRCVCVGVPIWFVIGVLATFSPEIGKELAVRGGPVNAAKFIM